ncbi:hypothetical protein HZA75_02780 [Candidatus Roizmanbacteria bacterium]|nr:hypothetical protein [Candidatus Roizmanbacteria bacterium]
MKNIYDYLIKHSVPAVFTALTGITLVTSAAGVVKVAGNINSFKPKVPEIKTVEAALQEDFNLSKSEEKTPVISPIPKVTQAVHIVSPTTAPPITINGGVHNSVKSNVSVRSDKEERADDQDKKKNENGDKSDDSESSHAKLELDNDTEVSHQDGKLNLDTGVKVSVSNDSNSQ